MKNTVDCIYKKVLNSLDGVFNSLNTKPRLLLAVSGGVDSMVMLSMLYRYMCETGKISFSVVTVNHNIREKLVSARDCLLVSDYCNEKNILCEIVEIPQGKILEFAKKRNKGIEETARFLRYEIFTDKLRENDAQYILTAHNKNDNLETIIQRFLQGSLMNGGIEFCHNSIFRPLLVLSRDEIELYAQYFKIPYAIDETNLQTDYYRNKIRNILIPLLNEEFTGWNSGIEKGAIKKRLDEDFFSQEVAKYHFTNMDDGACCFPLDIFETLHESLKIRLFYKTLVEMSVGERIPFSVIHSFFLTKKAVVCKNISFFVKDKKVWIKKLNPSSINKDFFAIIEKIGVYKIPFGVLEITDEKKVIKNCLCLKGIHFPFSLYENQKKLTFIFSDGEECVLDKEGDFFSNKEIMLNSKSEFYCFIKGWSDEKYF